MLNLYFGRANLDREKLMYEKIAELGRRQRVIVLVPDQFTIEAERKAFAELAVYGLMNVEIMSFSRLGMKILQEVGGGNKIFLDDLGKGLLLRKVAIEHKSALRVYGRQCQQNAFIKRMMTLIGEMKQFNVTAKKINQVLDREAVREEDGYMALKKLQDVQVLFQAYEEELSKGYMDMEDYLSLLAQKVGQARFLQGAVVWIDGFDSYTKKTLTIVAEILKIASEVNITFIGSPKTADKKNDQELFSLSEKSMRAFEEMALDLGIPCFRREITRKYERDICQDVHHLEQNMFAYPHKVYLDEPQALKVLACADYYSEAETVAAAIIDLVEQKGYRFREIGVVCNDIESRGVVLKRVFEKAGIFYFMDQKRGILHNPFVQFILALLQVVEWGCRYEDMFRLIRTDLFELSIDEHELLENYVLKYAIRGYQWDHDFYRWEQNDGQDELQALNETRRKIMALVNAFKEEWQQCRTGGEKTQAFYDFLKSRVNLPEKAEQVVEKNKAEQLYEAALETAQIWNTIVGVFAQINQLTADVEIDTKLYFEMLTAGFEAIEIGLIPTTMDQVLVGNLQRTKTGSIRALFVIGANDGILPVGEMDEGIFHEEEKRRIADLGIELGKRDEMRREEETLAVYKMFSRPSEYLQLTFTTSDGENGEAKPSVLVERIKKLFPRLVIEKGLFTGGAEEASGEFKSRINYMLSRDGWDQLLAMLQRGVSFENIKKQLDPEVFQALYPSELILSPTSLEAFSRCPFSHFLKYGIKADERRVFEVAAPEIGTLFHETLMAYSERVTAQNQWQEITPKQCRNMVAEILEMTAAGFRKGMLFENESGKYRIDRMKAVCEKTAWMLTEHVNRGQFEEFYFETGFGRGQQLPPIEIEVASGRRVFIEGRIDRIDVMKDGDSQYIKVIDYKSGNEKVVKKELLSGYKLQLMLYINAAIQGFAKERRRYEIKPAGVFYFKIQEPVANAEKKEGVDETELKDFLEQELSKAFKMDGIVVNDLKVIEGLDEEFSGFSEIVRVRKNKDGTVKGTGDFAALSPDEFEELRTHVEELTISLCEDFASGRVDIAPKRGDGEKNACTFCKFKAICMFDRTCRGFEFVR